MKKIFFLLIILPFWACNSNKKFNKKEDVTQFVNPFIGTDGPGNTYPGATTPFGMVQVSPDIGIEGWDRISGYFYQDSIISGFSHLHLSGTGAGDLYDVLLMPTNSRFSKRIAENNFKPFSFFNHKTETATAGYYSVFLESFGIQAEVTATPRVGIQQYLFPTDTSSQIHLDLGYRMNWDKPTQTHIKIVNNTTIEGFRHSTGWAKNQQVFFVIQFSEAFESQKLFSKNELVEEQEATSENTRLIVNFSTPKSKKIVVKTAISSASIQGAYKNMKAEAPDFNFEKYRKKARNLWQQQLSKIHIKTNSDQEKNIFYTMLYQSMLAPNLLSDVDGKYKGANHILQTAKDFHRYDTFSLWDTFRATHPLYTLLHQQKTKEFIASFLAHYKEVGKLPVWSMQGNETHMMIGNHAIPVIVDAFFKGIEMDKNLAYEACKMSSLNTMDDFQLYQKYNFVPYDLDPTSENWSVSKTLEYAYNDWCVAQFAKALQKEDDYLFFLKRSENWRNLFDKKTTFFRPKNSQNKFIFPFKPKEYSNYFCESNAWQYRWFVPHNIKGFIQAMGGVDAFETKLDSMFSLASTKDEKLPIFSTGMIGQYVHGNEPSHHVAYLYNYTKSPSKTQQRVQQILKTQYKNQPNGHCGNEDCGQMSAWYVLSALGFYPINPANGVYALGVPAFKEISIELENGKIFTIQARNLSEKNKYIKDLYLNNKPYNKLYLLHSDILKGGKLVFDMNDKPQDERLSKYEMY